MPQLYEDILDANNLNTKDVETFENDYYIRENDLRNRFRDYVANNKTTFGDYLKYTRGKNGKIELIIDILEENEIKECSFKSFKSNTGGKLCAAEIAQLLAELFGSKVKYPRMKQKVVNVKSTAKNQVFIILSPQMCSNAVIKGAELYNKVFLQGLKEGVFMFIDIPLGTNPTKEDLKKGINARVFSNK